MSPRSKVGVRRYRVFRRLRDQNLIIFHLPFHELLIINSHEACYSSPQHRRRAPLFHRLARHRLSHQEGLPPQRPSQAAQVHIRKLPQRTQKPSNRQQFITHPHNHKILPAQAYTSGEFPKPRETVFAEISNHHLNNTGGLHQHQYAHSVASSPRHRVLALHDGGNLVFQGAPSLQTFNKNCIVK